MSEVLTYMPEPVVFTDSAAAKVYELIAEEGNDNLKLRVFITGGGCSGFQYGFTFDETINPDDTIVEKIISLTEDKKAQDPDEEDSDDGSSTGKTTPALKKSNLSVNKTEEDESGSIKATTLPDKQHTVQLLIDPMSLQYLLGAEIDYTEGLEGAQFVIRNPQAKTTCGCGSSFSI